MRQHPSSPLKLGDMGWHDAPLSCVYLSGDQLLRVCISSGLVRRCLVGHFVHLATGPDSGAPLRPSRATIAIADDSFVVTLVAFGGGLTACVHRSRPRPLLSYRSRLPWPPCDTPRAPPHSSRHQIIVVALRMLLSAVAPPYCCLHSFGDSLLRT